MVMLVAGIKNRTRDSQSAVALSTYPSVRLLGTLLFQSTEPSSSSFEHPALILEKLLLFVDRVVGVRLPDG